MTNIKPFRLQQQINTEANKEGWGIFFTGNNQSGCHNRFELQRLDEANIFPSDTEVHLHVVNLAANNTESVHGKAIRFLCQYSPNEVDSIMRSSVGHSSMEMCLQSLNVHL